MLSIGGIQDEDWQTFTDPWANGLGIFDLTALNWTNAYNHTADPYEPSSLVTNYYSSNARYPKSWADPALQVIFETNSASTTSSGSSPASSSTSSDAGTPSNPTSGNTGTLSSISGPGRTGAIVGGVVGGVVALSIIGAVIFYYKRKQRHFYQISLASAEMAANPAIAQLPATEDWKAVPAEADGNGLHELYTEPR